MTRNERIRALAEQIFVHNDGEGCTAEWAISQAVEFDRAWARALVRQTAQEYARRYTSINSSLREALSAELSKTLSLPQYQILAMLDEELLASLEGK